MHYGTEDVYVSVLEHVQYLESSSLIIYFLWFFHSGSKICREKLYHWCQPGFNNNNNNEVFERPFSMKTSNITKCNS